MVVLLETMIFIKFSIQEYTIIFYSVLSEAFKENAKVKVKDKFVCQIRPFYYQPALDK